MEYLMLIGGLLLLIASGEALVKGAVGIALMMRISTLVIGMTIVSFGTSAPELLVSVKAALKGHPDIAIGAVIGSNISNITLVLGITAMIFPITVQRDSLVIDWPLMMLATIGFYIAVLNMILGTYEGLAFVVLLITFSLWLIRRSRKNNPKISDDNKNDSRRKNIGMIARNLALIVAGSFGLAIGADLFLDGADDIALNFGVSHRVIGITLVAFGTSVPELITSCVAAFRKQTDISIGNLIGSNVFNLLGILGVTALVKEIRVNPLMLNFDVFWLLGISALLLPIMLFGRKVFRLEGLILLIIYALYIFFVVTKDVPHVA